MKFILTLAALAFASSASAETWQCTDASGHTYTVSQSVPVDQCKLVDSVRSPHGPEPLEARSVPRPYMMASRAPGASCNQAAALDVQAGIAEFAKAHTEGVHLAVYWVYAIERLPEAERLRMVRTYADMDACLSGAAREIHFYRKDKVMGIASPTSGIRLVK